MEKTVELLMKNASLLDVELVAGALKQEGIPHFIKEKGPGGIYCGGAIMGADLILECLDRGLYPSWDAQNLDSLSLAKKLGYEFSHEYPAYEIFDY